MDKTGKIQISGKLVALDRLSQRRRHLYALNLLFLVLCLVIFTLSFNRLISYEDGLTRSTFTIPGPLPIPVLEMRPARGETPLVAVIAHGFAGSKDLMTSFGVELARAGITAYLFDFPGHGESPIPLGDSTYSDRVAQQNVAVVSEVVDYARTTNNVTKKPQIILLGHSMGSAAVGDYSMAHADNDDIVSTILVSPVGLEQPTQAQPRNLLILAGQNDISFAITNSQRLQRLGCGLSASQPLPMQCGNPTDGSGRRMVILPVVNHITILNASSTFREVLNWLKQEFPQQVNTDQMQSDMRLFWMLLGAAGVLLSIFPLCALLADIFDIHATTRAFRGREILLFFLFLLLGIAAAIGIQLVWRPFSFIHVMLADYVSGYFFFTAVIMALLIFALRRTIPVPLLRQIAQQILVGVILAAFLYFTLGQLATFSWQRFTFTLPRLWRFAAIFLLVLPIFLLDEGISRGYQEHGLWRGLLASFFFKVLLTAGLLTALLLTPGLGFLSIVLPVLALLFLALVAFCTQLYANGRAAIAGAILSALLIAWMMSTTFPIT